jgi:hypothetical protein
MKKKLMSLTAALLMLFSVFVVTSEQAEARRGGGGLAAGLAVGALLGLGIAGAYAGPRYYGGPAYYGDVGPGCYRGPRQCGWAGRRCFVDRYGEQVCRGGEWRCWRPTICD